MTGLRIDTDAIRQLAEILQDTGLTEIEVCEKECRIRVVRAPPAITAAVAAPAPGALPAVAAQAPAPASLPEPEAELALHPGAVTSPMVGIAYLGPEPGAASYVSVGQNVVAGQTLLLIEAMKTYNQIKAPKSGIIGRIVIASGVPVEYGEVLMVID